MFRAKLHSEILDFSNDFQLLQFQFDRWLYKTVSGGGVVLIASIYTLCYYKMYILFG